MVHKTRGPIARSIASGLSALRPREEAIDVGEMGRDTGMINRDEKVWE